MPLNQAPIEIYSDDFPSILAVAEGLRAPRHADLDMTWFLANPSAQQFFPPGLFVYTSGTFPAPNNTIPRGRLLPRAVTAAQANTGATSLVLRSPIAGVFRVGETISAATGIAANTGALTGAVALGTVTGVPLNPNTGRYDTLQFSTPLAANLAAGSFIALTAPIPSTQLIGLICPNTVIDLKLRANSQFGVFTQATVYNTRMPQPFSTAVGTDAQLLAAFPDIKAVDILP